MFLKRIYIAYIFLLFFACKPHAAFQWQNGDIIFQQSRSSQGEELRIATNSNYTHVGVIYAENGKAFVFEAASKVELTPLEEFIQRDPQKHYVIKRLKNANEILTKENLLRLKHAAKFFSGKNYDIYFKWDDSRIYCSELVWKLYKKALNIEIAKLEKYKDFNLGHPKVAALLEKRFGDNIPFNETVISPVGIFNSDVLKTVFSN